jgi:hypothetical protein
MRRLYKPDLGQRRFPRLKTPVFYRPSTTFGTSRHASNLSLGGVRIFCNNPLKENELLDIELAFPDGKSIVATARVIWIKALPPGSTALYDVGLEFSRIAPEALQELKSYLDRASQD